MRNGRWFVLVIVMCLAAGQMHGQSTSRASTDGTGSPTDLENAQAAIRLLALRSPNPYVRQTAYHDRDTDWSFDLPAGTFSVKIRGPEEKTCSGKLVYLESNKWTATFDDEEALSRDWIVSPDSVLTPEEARRCLSEMGNRMSGPDILKRICDAMKNALPTEPSATGELTDYVKSSSENVNWHINLREKTFTLHMDQAGGSGSRYTNDISGRFGYDKDHKWTAWPVELTSTSNTGRGSQPSQPVIPEHNFAGKNPTFPSSAMAGHSGETAVDGNAVTFWQPNANYTNPVWIVDLKNVIVFSRIRLTYPVPGGYRLKIDVSDDNKTWLPYGDRLDSVQEIYSGASHNNNTLEVRAPENTTGRFVRLSFLSQAPDAPIQLSEVVIEGALPKGTVTPRLDPAPELKIDEQTLARATERGEALLKSAKWKVPVETGSSLVSAKIKLYDADNLVVCSHSRDTIAVDKTTGNQVWTMTGMSIMAVGMGNKGAEMIVTKSQRINSGFGTTNNNIIATEMLGVADRASRWQSQLESGVSSVLLSSKQFFTGATAGAWYADGPQGSASGYSPSTLILRAYDRLKGEKQWSYTLPSGTVGTQLTFENGVLYVVALSLSSPSAVRGTSRLIALNSADGNPVFESPLQELINPVAIKNGEIVASSSSGEVIGFDVGTGQERWRERIQLSREPGKARLTEQVETTEAPVFAGDMILVPVRGTTNNVPARNIYTLDTMPGLAAFDSKTHKQIWFFRPPQVRFASLWGIQVYKEKIAALVSGTGTLPMYIGVDMKTGKLDWQIPATIKNTSGLYDVAPPLVSNGIMYIVKDSKLIAIPLY